MKTVKKTAEYTIYQKRNGRFAVKGADKKWVNKDDKVAILLDAGLIKVTLPAEKPAEEAPAEEAAAEEASADSTENSEG